MKRNRAKYVVYFGKNMLADYKNCNSKLQAKKALFKYGMGEIIKVRLIHERSGVMHFWNMDRDYPSFTLGI